jgi:hypothetical protein
MNYILAALAFGLFIIGFWKEDPVVWFLDTIFWLVESYLLWSQASAAGFANTYVPTALALIGASFTLVSLYKAIASVIAIMNERRSRRPIAASYDEEKAINARRIYDITRRR